MREAIASSIPKNRFSLRTAGFKRHFFLICLLTVVSPSAFGQIHTLSQVEEPSGAVKPSASDLLTPQQTDGRFGSHVRGGYLSPTPFQNRFADSGLVFTEDGSFLGTTESSGSRIGGSFSPSVLPGEANLDLLESRQENQAIDQFRAALEARARQQQLAEAASQPPIESPQQKAVVEAFPEDAAQPQGEQKLQEQIWMRGSATGKSPAGARPATEAGGVDLQSRFVGGQIEQLPLEQLPPATTSATSRATSPTGSPVTSPDNRQSLPLLPSRGEPRGESAEQIQDQLQLLLLRSPQVNPLSPIEVTFQDGKATIQGVVPSQTHRLEAGRILLTDSRVQSVDNRLTVLQGIDPLTPYTPESNNTSPSNGGGSAADQTKP